MKKISIILLFFIPIIVFSQVNITKKPVKILQFGKLAWSQTLNMIIANSDTTYAYYFRNTIYKEIIDMKSIEFTKPELKEFAKGLNAVLLTDYKEMVWVNHIGISKLKSPFGGSYYELYYDSGLSNLNLKELNKLIETINQQ
jgi:hypothetical protein